MLAFIFVSPISHFPFLCCIHVCFLQTFYRVCVNCRFLLFSQNLFTKPSWYFAKFWLVLACFGSSDCGFTFLRLKNQMGFWVLSRFLFWALQLQKTNRYSYFFSSGFFVFLSFSSLIAIWLLRKVEKGEIIWFLDLIIYPFVWIWLCYLGFSSSWSLNFYIARVFRRVLNFFEAFLMLVRREWTFSALCFMWVALDFNYSFTSWVMVKIQTELAFVYMESQHLLICFFLLSAWIMAKCYLIYVFFF